MESKTKQILEALKMQPLSEEEKARRHILGRLYGPIATTKEKTRNGRGYNRELWERALADDLFREKLDTKCLFLELGHPEKRETTDMSLACACIPEMPRIVDGDLYAYVDILDTPNGRILKTLCDYGFIPGISSRGSGDIMANDEVDPETFFLETWDIVQIPAVKKARLAVCEAFDPNKARLRKALTESYEKSSAEDKKIMEATLNSLNIKLELNEDAAPEYKSIEDVPVGDVLEEGVGSDDIEETPVVIKPTEIKDIAVDAAKAALAEEEKAEEILPEEEVKEITDEVVDNAINAPEEGDEIELPADENPEVNTAISSIEEPHPKVEITNKEAGDAGDEGVIESIKDIVRQKDLLEGQVKDLQNQKTVSDAEVNRLKEDLNKYKNAFLRVSELAAKANEYESANRALSEQLEKKNTEIKDLQSKVNSQSRLTESVNAKDAEIATLKEKLISAQNEAEKTETALNEQLSETRQKLRSRTDLAKHYKAKYQAVLEGYVASKANMLGVRPSDITSKLNENYSLEDVDKVYEALLTAPVGWGNLPSQGMTRGQGRIQTNEGLGNQQKIDYSNPDNGYEIDDDLLELAGLK